jgi:hypothetical protein
MKKLFGLFSKPEPKKPVEGITYNEWVAVFNAISREYEEARLRQFTKDAKPSAYMRGLSFALKALNKFKPHVVGVEA